LIILIILAEEYKFSLCSFLQPPASSSLFGPNILLWSLRIADVLSHCTPTSSPVFDECKMISSWSVTSKPTLMIPNNLIYIWT
jgi:hypothetical protein